MSAIKKFCLLKNSYKEEYVVVEKGLIYELNENEKAVRIGDRIRKGANGSLQYKNNSGQWVHDMKIIDCDDDKEVLKKRWTENNTRVRINKKPYTPSTVESKLSGTKATTKINEQIPKKIRTEKPNDSAAQYLRDLLSKKSPTKSNDVDSAESTSSHASGERPPLKNITNGKKDAYEETPCRVPSTITNKSHSSVNDLDEELIARKRMRGVSGIGWKRKIDDTLMTLQKNVQDLQRKSKTGNDEAVENPVNLEEKIVIDQGEQITTINNVSFTSSQLVNVVRQKSMKKRLCCLVPVVWNLEIYKKKYIDPPEDTGDYLLITDADKFKFDQLCLHLQNRKRINYARGGEDDLELNSKTWLGRRCTELRSAIKNKEKRTKGKEN